MSDSICLGGCFTIPQSALQLTLFVFYYRFDVTGTRMSLPIALVVGIAAGGATLLAAAAVLLALWCAARRRARRNRNSDTGSSDPSTLGELRMANSSLCTSICFVLPFTVLTAKAMRQWSGERGAGAQRHRSRSIRLRGNSRWRTWCRPPRTSATRTSSARGASDWCTWACFLMALLSRSRGAWGQQRRCLLMR